MDAAILRLLYAEIGIAIDSSPSSQLQRELEVTARETSTLETATVQEEANPKEAILNAETQDKDARNFARNSSILAIANEKNAVTTSNTVNAPKKASMSTASAKTSVLKAGESKPLDRKDYIARMLAAKTGKPIASTSPSTAMKSSAVANVDSGSQMPISGAAVLPSNSAAKFVAPAIDEPMQDKPSIVLPQSHSDDRDIDAKRKAQTDLARQKMEALKSQRQTMKVTGSTESANHDQIARPATNAQPLTVAPVTIPPQPVPSRQGSYFSPVSQKAPFSIPGLFMKSASMDSVKPLEIGQTQHSATVVQGQQERSAPAPSLDQATEVDQAPSAAPIDSPVADPKKKAVIVDPAAPAITHRKRQKAADFLDPPITRIKRPLGQQEDSSIIIDVSDEDIASSSDSDSMDMDIADDQEPASKNARVDDFGNSQRKSIRDLPPLSDFPSRKRAPAITPPSAPTPSQAKDSKGLKTKEMEIERMNRKIAELEQRISAKKTTSRAVTPGSSGNTTVSPAPNDISQDDEAVYEVKEAPEAADRDGEGGRTRRSSLSTTDHVDTVTAERKLLEVERAKASVERSLAAEVARASNERLPQQETVHTAQAQEHPTLQEDLQRANASKNARQHTTKQEQTHGERDHQAHDEAISLPTKTDLHFRHLEKQDLHKVQQSSDREEEQGEIPEEQRHARRLAIETGLPMLDATVEKTKQKLESMRKEIADLEREVQKGIDGRKALVEELKSLSQVTESPRAPHEGHQSDKDGHVEQISGKTESQGKYLQIMRLRRIRRRASND